MGAASSSSSSSVARAPPVCATNHVVVKWTIGGVAYKGALDLSTAETANLTCTDLLWGIRDSYDGQPPAKLVLDVHLALYLTSAQGENFARFVGRGRHAARATGRAIEFVIHPPYTCPGYSRIRDGCLAFCTARGIAAKWKVVSPPAPARITGAPGGPPRPGDDADDNDARRNVAPVIGRAIQRADRTNPLERAAVYERGITQANMTGTGDHVDDDDIIDIGIDDIEDEDQEDEMGPDEDETQAKLEFIRLRRIALAIGGILPRSRPNPTPAQMAAYKEAVLAKVAALEAVIHNRLVGVDAIIAEHNPVNTFGGIRGTDFVWMDFLDEMHIQERSRFVSEEDSSYARAQLLIGGTLYVDLIYMIMLSYELKMQLRILDASTEDVDMPERLWTDMLDMIMRVLKARYVESEERSTPQERREEARRALPTTGLLYDPSAKDEDVPDGEEPCVVCLADRRIVTAVPCNHEVTCVFCSDFMVKNMQPLDSGLHPCPMCRTPIQYFEIRPKLNPILS